MMYKNKHKKKTRVPNNTALAVTAVVVVLHCAGQPEYRYMEAKPEMLLDTCITAYLSETLAEGHAQPLQLQLAPAQRVWLLDIANHTGGI